MSMSSTGWRRSGSSLPGWSGACPAATIAASRSPCSAVVARHRPAARSRRSVRSQPPPSTVAEDHELGAGRVQSPPEPCTGQCGHSQCSQAPELANRPLKNSVIASRKKIPPTSPPTTRRPSTTSMITTTLAVRDLGGGRSWRPWLRMWPVSDPELSNDELPGWYMIVDDAAGCAPLGAPYTVPCGWCPRAHWLYWGEAAGGLVCADGGGGGTSVLRQSDGG